MAFIWMSEIRWWLNLCSCWLYLWCLFQLLWSFHLNFAITCSGIQTSTVDMRDETRGRPIQKAKVFTCHLYIGEAVIFWSTRYLGWLLRLVIVKFSVLRLHCICLVCGPLLYQKRISRYLKAPISGLAVSGWGFIHVWLCTFAMAGWDYSGKVGAFWWVDGSCSGGAGVSSWSWWPELAFLFWGVGYKWLRIPKICAIVHVSFDNFRVQWSTWHPWAYWTILIWVVQVPKSPSSTNPFQIVLVSCNWSVLFYSFLVGLSAPTIHRITDL